MSESSWIFTAPMVRAILSNAKTQTRRVVTDRTMMGNVRVSQCDLSTAWVDPGLGDGPYLHAHVLRDRSGADVADDEIIERLYPRRRIGDRVWVREAWQIADWTEDGYPCVRYRADGAVRFVDGPTGFEAGFWCEDTWAVLSEPSNVAVDGKAADRRWRPSIHMPRWASRITLEVTDVRIQRVQDISEEAARAEGITTQGVWWDAGPNWEGDGLGETATEAFQYLWDRINRKRAPWASNPWVIAYTFRRVG